MTAEISVSFLYSTNNGLTKIQQAAQRKLMKRSLQLQGTSINILKDGIKGEAIHLDASNCMCNYLLFLEICIWR